ncbi:hypothetical protein FNV43_RR18779 [Rhamnella rubrinervis]|uniref:WAT1-related protein n=1 Tax=Rhamnella rubrinervis TaxID=2594499 RepID=A0A8K0E003_9ROSA|nr:hypothetical protein FNV43_RR18779 [Rhamnella rubrinervis]
MKMWNFVSGLKPVLLMVLVQAWFGGAHVGYKMALYDGMSAKIMVAYRFIFASAFMVALAFFVERGSMVHNLYAESLSLTSATFVSAMSNLIPALSFILAVIFRMEKLGIGSLAGKAKVVGVMAKMSEKYPPYSATALMCLFASIQATVYAMLVERDWSKWKLGWNIRLLAVLYAGILPSGICVTAMAWCSNMKGAFFVSAFYPLMLVFVAIAGSLFLEEHLHLGRPIWSVVGKERGAKADFQNYILKRVNRIGTN